MTAKKSASFDKPDRLTFLPLGGCNEIGMNLALYGYKGKWLMVDCGVSFGDESTPGIDIITPDIEFIARNADKLLAIVVTHAHEDHIGALPYLWPELKAPIYATPFTASVLKRKFAENDDCDDVAIHILPMSGTVKIGEFDLQLITLTHSTLEPNAVVIRTPAGAILHTGDWKLDPDPVVGDPTDEAALKALASENILAMICDSTNVFVEGSTGSEADVAKALIPLIKEQKNGVAVACFASNVARLRSIAEAAEACGRTIVMAGRSLRRIYEAARENGYLLDVAPFIDVRDAKHLPAEHALYVCTGSQGEPRSALSRIAAGDHPEIKFRAGDVVIFSSRQIPGNEKAISRIQNRLAASGVQIITDKQATIHVSGHPARDELRQMYAWVKPRCVIPVHGEHRHLVAQAELALSCQVPQALVVQNGDVVTFGADGTAAISGQVPSGRLALQGERLVNVKSTTIRQLHKVIESGYVVVSLALTKNGALAAPIEVSSIGMFEDDELDGIGDRMEELVELELEKVPAAQLGNDDLIEGIVKKALRQVAREEIGKKPRMDVHILRV
ncbi:MAG: ribonuclease J [Alphaproteobacteria bacterium]|nr:ribonuclease J [Alphaproteobacteria bacterium]